MLDQEGFEEVNINPVTGMRIGTKVSTEMRGDEKEYDAWLRIPIAQVEKIASKMISKCLRNDKSVYNDISASGASHINRVFFSGMWKKCDNRIEIINTILDKCNISAKIMFTQFYAHRLFESKHLDKCQSMFDKSIEMALSMPHPSWDKWVASAYLFKAKYSSADSDKEKFCIDTILKPRDIVTFSPHLKYWKLFRAAAWLVGNGVPHTEALNRYKSLNFVGYKEYRGSEKSRYDTRGILDDPAKCKALMTNDIGHPYLGNP